MMRRLSGGLLAALVLAMAAPGFAQANDKELAKERERIAKMEKSYSTAKTAYKSKPQNATLKKGYVDSTVKLGTAIMNTPSQPPRVKYPRALALYREALALDPKNKEALEGKALIEGIYKSMGRPIPK